jgi:hypothetical protein
MKGSSQPSISRHYDTIKRQTGNASKCAIFAQQPEIRPIVACPERSTSFLLLEDI